MMVILERLLRLSLLPVTLLAACLDKVGGAIGIGVPCIFKTLFDIECPGCGITHAIIDIWEGNLMLSYHHNKLGVLVFMVIVYISINEFVSVKLTNDQGRRNG